MIRIYIRIRIKSRVMNKQKLGSSSQYSLRGYVGIVDHDKNLN